MFIIQIYSHKPLPHPSSLEEYSFLAFKPRDKYLPTNNGLDQKVSQLIWKNILKKRGAMEIDTFLLKIQLPAAKWIREGLSLSLYST